MDSRDRIKLIRKKFKLSQAKFGEKIGISSSQIACYETKYRDLPMRVINDICREYNINKEWLIDGSGEMYSISKEDDELLQVMAELTVTDNKKLKKLVVMINQLEEQYLKSIYALVKTLPKKHKKW